MTVRSVLLPRTTLTFIAASGLALSGAVALGTGWAASATPTNPHKVWVCKFVQKPHQNEVLKAGKNPIFVDWAALTGRSSAPHVGDMFSDAQGRSVVVQIGGTNPGVGACGVKTPPTTTHTNPPTTTHTNPPTTRHTNPPTTTHVVPRTTASGPPASVPPSVGGVGGGVGGVVGGVGAGGENGVVGGVEASAGNGAAMGPVPGVGAPDTGGAGDAAPIGLLAGPGLLAAGFAVGVGEAVRRRRSAEHG